jgi:hypothetical protein
VTPTVDHSRDTAAHRPTRPSTARLLLQLVGFAIGCAILAWCAARAWRDGGEGFAKLLDASWPLKLALVGSTLVSILCSGLTFWSVAKPLRSFGIVEMQAVNLMASLFNYAPVRLGLVLRCAYHWRVDRMPMTDLAAWIAGVAIVTLGALGAGLVAGLVQIPLGIEQLRLDLLWFATYFACLGLGSALTMLLARIPAWKRLLKGAERVLISPRMFAESLTIRSIDLAMWGVRMWAAARILGITLNPAQAVLLAAIAILGAGNPMGRIGWREGLVAIVAPYVITSTDGNIDVLTSQLSLLESAGEAILTIPLGILGALWCARRLKRVPSVA